MDSASTVGGGLLGPLLAYIDERKRAAAGLLSDPGLWATRFNEDARAYNQERRAQTGANRSVVPEVRDAAMQQDMTQAMNAGGLLGLHTVYHGSPHKFDKFDSSKIGTGEGAQAYGHGIYFAENPKVAQEYQTATSKDRFLTRDGFFEPSQLEHLNVRVKARSGDIDQAIAEAKKYARPDHDYPETAAKAARDLAKLEALKASGGYKPNPGKLYKADLPDEWLPKMLDWDKPLSQQPEAVRVAAQDLGLSKNATGKDVYNALANQARDISIIRGNNASTTLGASQAGASADLSGFGIPGIRYLDGGSRGAGQGTYNYVVFPGMEKYLKILGVE